MRLTLQVCHLQTVISLHTKFITWPAVINIEKFFYLVLVIVSVQYLKLNLLYMVGFKSKIIYYELLKPKQTGTLLKDIIKQLVRFNDAIVNKIDPSFSFVPQVAN